MGYLKVISKSILISLLLVMGLLISVSANVSALSRTYYDDSGDTAGECDVGKPSYKDNNYQDDYCDPDHRVILLAGENNDVPIEHTVLQANFKTNGPKPQGQSIVIRGAHLCAGNPDTVLGNNRDAVLKGYYTDNTADTPNTDKINGVGDFKDEGSLYGKDVTKYSIGTQVRMGKFRKANAADCNADPNITITLTDNDFQKVDPEHPDNAPGWWFVKIVAEHIGQHGPRKGTTIPDCPKGGNDTTKNFGPCDGLVNSFRVTAEGDKARTVTTYSTDQSCGNGECVTLRSAKGTGNEDYDHYLTYKLRFGSACTVESPEPQDVSFYDLDYGVETDDGRHVVKFTMRGEWPEQQPDGSIRIVVKWWWGVNGVEDWRDTKPSYNDAYMVRPENGDTSRVRFMANPDGKYTAFVMNFGPHLAFQAGLPYDGVYYSIDCGGSNNAEAIPHAELDSRDGYEPTETATGRTWVTNESSRTAKAKWERTFWYEKGDNDDYDAGVDSPIANGMESPGTLTDFPPGIESIIRSKPTNVRGNEKKICVGLRLYDPVLGTTIVRKAVDCQGIVKKPYLSVMNGDVNTTKDQVNVASCGVGDNKISAFWRLRGGQPQGSNSQLAVYAGSTVKDFVSAALRPSDPKWEKGLTFSNTSGATFGAAFGTYVGCANDADWAANDNTIGPNTLSAPIPGTVLGTKIYDTSLTINGDVNLPATFNLDNKPYLKVVVKGDIFIRSNVHHLDGIYMATGTIYTCTTGSSAPANIDSLRTACDNRLTVDGSLIANDIKFLRLAGNLSNNNPAETFTYDPLNWIPTTQTGGGTSEFDSYTIMPPIL